VLYTCGIYRNGQNVACPCHLPKGMPGLGKVCAHQLIEANLKKCSKLEQHGHGWKSPLLLVCSDYGGLYRHLYRQLFLGKALAGTQKFKVGRYKVHPASIC
jgi:hypothetical protein